MFLANIPLIPQRKEVIACPIESKVVYLPPYFGVQTLIFGSSGRGHLSFVILQIIQIHHGRTCSSQRPHRARILLRRVPCTPSTTVRGIPCTPLESGEVCRGSDEDA
jgi:hypothetical protein